MGYIPFPASSQRQQGCCNALADLACTIAAMHFSNLFSPALRVDTICVLASLTYVLSASVHRVRKSKRLVVQPVRVSKHR